MPSFGLSPFAVKRHRMGGYKALSPKRCIRPFYTQGEVCLLVQQRHNLIGIDVRGIVPEETGIDDGLNLCTIDGLPIVWLQSAAARAGQPAIYLSAGVHGDEPGATSGLLLWAQTHLPQLASGSFIVYPCLNPHGLRLNTRADHRGLDLNRRFHLDDDPICGPWRRLMAEKAVRLCLCLHEDYDAHGCYIYELSHHPKGWSRPILERCTSKRLPIDSRKSIEGRTSAGGIIQRRTPPDDLPGLPEAIVLYQFGSPVSMTFETPSEFSLEDRANAHALFIEHTIRLQILTEATS